MARKIGRSYTVGVGIEGTGGARGTAVAPQTGVLTLELGYEEKFEKVKNESMFGNIAKISGAEMVKNWSEGDFSMKLLFRTIGYFLTAVFGQPPTSVQDAATGVYANTYTMLNSNQHRSLTLAIKNVDEDLRFPLVMVDTFSIETDTEGFVEVSGDFVGKAPATATNTISFTDEPEAIGADFQLKRAASFAALDAATAEADVNTASLEINKSLEQIYTLGSTQPTDIINTTLEVEGEIELYGNDIATWRTRVKNNVQEYLRYQWKNTRVTHGTGSPTVPNPTLAIDVAAMYDDPETDYDADAPVMYTVNWFGVFPFADGKMIQAVLTNTTNGATAYTNV
jgi:hypothetical protein